MSRHYGRFELHQGGGRLLFAGESKALQINVRQGAQNSPNPVKMQETTARLILS